jgi:hypothetical protein
LADGVFEESEVYQFVALGDADALAKYSIFKALFPLSLRREGTA